MSIKAAPPSLSLIASYTGEGDLVAVVVAGVAVTQEVCDL
jgi:hypothetical protein